MLRFAPEKIGRVLFATGWGILLLYIPSGWLHHIAGAFVYLRDILLALHLFASLVYLSNGGQLKSLLSGVWMLLIISGFLLPSLFFPDDRIEVGGYLKWSAIWLDSIILGRLSAQQFDWNNLTKALAIFSAVVLMADWGTGFYEWKNNVFAIPMRGQLSPMGVEMGKDQSLQKFKRVKGLQRDVFSFANLMGMAVVGGITVLVGASSPAIKCAALAWVGSFAFMLYNSGGRSAFFGVGAAGLMGAGLMFAPEVLHKQVSKFVLGWLLIGLFMSFFGVGRFTEWFSSSMLKGSHIGDARSAHLRDNNWEGIRVAISSVPIVLFTGSPLGSIIDSKVTSLYHWADNNYLWLLYHGSFISLVGVILYFRSVLARQIPSSRLWSKYCLVLFLLFVMGEAIARESMFFFGCVPLFLACGYVSGIRMALPSSSRSAGQMSESHLASLAVAKSIETRSSRSSRKTNRKLSEAEALANRIARRSRRDQPPES